MCLIKNQSGFGQGYTAITEIKQAKIGMNFGILKLTAGECYHFNDKSETACLLMTGLVEFECGNNIIDASRYCYFNQCPQAMHVDADTSFKVSAKSNAELVVIQAENNTAFEPIFFNQKNMLENDERGKGLLNDTSYRMVKTLFDKRNRPHSNLVLGEIITFPGHWSSTPSHTHPHPEIYHYRLSEPQGYAVGENGEDFVRIKHNDTMVITDSKAHAHSTAPGYCLYTLWFIRHLEGNPYIVPDFQAEHAWAKEKSANQRVWQLVEELQ